MGGTSWSTDFYKQRQTAKLQSGTDTFAYDQKLRQTTPVDQWKVHDNMNPFKVNRESRDSDVHPESLAIGVVFDVTGSMTHIPRELQKNLVKLMALLIQKGIVEHPQILFGAVGDAYTDYVPLQIGQFESGVEMDEDLERIVLEGHGGGQRHESYELVPYFFARHTSIDCLEKRGKKGYLFTIGDEMIYDHVNAKQVLDLIGDDLQAEIEHLQEKGKPRKKADIPVKKIIEEVQEKYEYFHIIASGGHHGGEKHVEDSWRRLLGERVLRMELPDAICELIATTIGLCEGVIDLDDLSFLKGTDSNPRAADAVMKALAPYASSSSGSVARRATVEGDMPITARRSGVVRV